jgi:hypothetical protein
MLACAALAGAQGYPKGSAYVDGSVHWESRELCPDATNWDVVAGYDFLIWNSFDLYAGPRVGWYTETDCTAARDWGVHNEPSVGGQLYFLYPSPFTKSLVLTCGIASDVMFNFDATENGAPVRVDLFGEVFLGIRLYLGERCHIETRFDAGQFAFFDSPPTFIKLGLLAGYDF